MPSDTYTHKVPSPAFALILEYHPSHFYISFHLLNFMPAPETRRKLKKKLIRGTGGRIYYNFLTKQNILKTRQMLQQDFCPVQSSRRLFLCIHINSSSHETWKNQTKKRKFESFDRQISQLHGHCVEIWQRKSAGIYKYSVLLCVFIVYAYTQLRGAVVSSCVDRVCVWYTRREKQRDCPMFSFSQTLSTERNGL